MSVRATRAVTLRTDRMNICNPPSRFQTETLPEVPQASARGARPTDHPTVAERACTRHHHDHAGAGDRADHAAGHVHLRRAGALGGIGRLIGGVDARVESPGTGAGRPAQRKRGTSRMRYPRVRPFPHLVRGETRISHTDNGAQSGFIPCNGGASSSSLPPDVTAPVCWPPATLVGTSGWASGTARRSAMSVGGTPSVWGGTGRYGSVSAIPRWCYWLGCASRGARQPSRNPW